MVSIIRSPTISDEKRKLTSGRSRAKEDLAEASRSNPIPANTSQTPTPSEPQSVSAAEVKNLVEQARLATLAQFKEEVESARDAARQQGLREGRAAGTEEAKQSFAAELARVKSVADHLHQSMEAGVLGMEDMAVAIAYEAVCKVLGNLAVTQEGLQAIVRQTASQIINAEKIVVRLHAADLSILRAAGALETTLPSGAEVSWVEDKNVALGGCVLETDGGDLDARLETQMDRLRTALVTARRSAAEQTATTATNRRSTDRRRSDVAR